MFACACDSVCGSPLQFRAWMHLFGWLQAIVAVALIAGLCVRSGRSSAYGTMTTSVLEGLSVGLLLLAPAAIPSLAFLAESLGTAHVLAYLEAAVVRARWKLRLAAHKIATATDPNYDPVLHKKGKTPTSPDGDSATNDPYVMSIVSLSLLPVLSRVLGFFLAHLSFPVLRVCVLSSGDGDDDDDSGDDDSGSDAGDDEYDEPADFRPGQTSTRDGPSFVSISGRGWRTLELHRKLHYFKRYVVHFFQLWLSER